MSDGKVQFLIPFLLLVTSGGIAGWTGFVLENNHETDTFDSPNYIPIINAVIGVMSFIVFCANLVRVFRCVNNEGCCNTGLGWLTFLFMIGAGTWLFVAGARLSKTERDFYRDNLNYYFELSIGQAAYMIVYCLIVIIQWVCLKWGLCKRCTGSDEYTLTDGHGQIYI